MYKKLNILDESDKHLRKISVDAKLPLSKEYKKIIKQIIDELTYSQIEELAEKYDLRPGMGLAFPQLGINERIIVIVHEVDEGKSGHVKRHARVTVEGYDEDGNKIRVRAREELSLAFQHEIDHLNGILFYDRIDKNKPFYTEEELRLI